MSESLRSGVSANDAAPEVAAYEREPAVNAGDFLINHRAIEAVTGATTSRRTFLQNAGAAFTAAVTPVFDAAISATNSPAEASEKIKETYAAARKLIATTKIHNGIHMINVYHNGAVAPLGELNTEAPELIAEHGIDDVLASLGFSDAVAFAAKFNEAFAHRSNADRERLLTDATFVAEMRAANHDIKIGNPQFINVRLALMIWLAVDKLTKDHSKTFSLGGKTFNTSEILKVLPGLKGNGLARLLLDHELAPHLGAMLELSKKKIRVPDVARLTVPGIVTFIHAAATVPTLDGRSVLDEMDSLYNTMRQYEGTGRRFIYDQFIASPMGKQYNAVMQRLNAIRLKRNNYTEPEVTTDQFSAALEKLPEDNKDFITINKFLSYNGN